MDGDVQRSQRGMHTWGGVYSAHLLAFCPPLPFFTFWKSKKTRPKLQGHLVKSSMPLPPRQPDLTPLHVWDRPDPARWARPQGGSHSKGERPGCRLGGGAAHKSGPTPTQSLTSGAAYPPTWGPCLWAATAAWNSQLAKASLSALASAPIRSPEIDRGIFFFF